MQDEHIFSGEQQPMLKSDTLVVTRDNYRTVLSDDDLGRLVRFEGVESRFGTALWGYKNTFPNYFANSVSYDVNSPGWEDIDQWATWATMRMLPGTNADTFFYGSAWFTYDAQAAGTGTNAAPGNYVVRTSGYSQFRDNKIPVSGSVVDLTVYQRLGQLCDLPADAQHRPGRGGEVIPPSPGRGGVPISVHTLRKPGSVSGNRIRKKAV